MKNVFLLFAFIILYSNTFAQAPSNDECENAITLTSLKDYCSNNEAYTNEGSTLSLDGQPSCWQNNSNGYLDAPSNDVWFKFTAIGDAINLSIKGNGTGGGTLKRPQIAIYIGNCNSGPMIQIACANYTGDQTTNSYASLYYNALSIGKEYYVVVDGYGLNTGTGTFQLCINNFNAPKIPGQDCSEAAPLCNKNSITVQSLKGPGIKETAGTCLDDVGGLGETDQNIAWYKFTVAKTGTLEFIISPNIPSNDVDWVLYELPADNCSAKTAVSCNGWPDTDNAGNNLPQGATGMKDFQAYPGIHWEGAKTITAGKTYGLMVNNWTTYAVGTDNGFTLSFGGTATFVGPKADFSASKVTACVNEKIDLTDASLGSPSSYSWDFGDDAVLTTDTTANPAGPHTVSYKKGGTKTIILKVGNGKCDDVFFQTINIDQPQDPAITGTKTICGGQTTTLTALATGATNYKWYDSLTGGNVFFTGANYTTSVLTADTTFYVEVISGSCASANRTPITIKVNTVGKPTTSNDSLIYCAINKKRVIDLLTPVNPNLKWYDAISAGNVLTDSTLLSSRNYYATLTDSLTNCESYERLLVNVIINDTVPPVLSNDTLTFCGKNNLKVSDLTPSGSNIKWYDAPIAGNLLKDTALLVNDKKYYAAQMDISSSCESSVRQYALVSLYSPVKPSGSALQNFCAINKPSISKLLPTGADIRWYEDSLSNNLLGALTPLANGKTYYASQILGACESMGRLAVTVNLADTALPTASKLTQEFCYIDRPTVKNLSATGKNIYWYDVLNDGIPLDTAAALTSKTYYASQVKAGGCESSGRLAITVLINDTVAPVILNNIQKFCASNNPKISDFTPSGESFKWYDAPSGGNLLPNLTDLTDNTTYYLAQKASLTGCESSLRATVTAKIDTVTEASLALNAITTVCDGQSAKIEINNPTNGTTYHVYSSFNSPNPVGDAPYTFIPKNDTIYYVDAINNSGCRQSKPRTPILIKINALPKSPNVIASSLVICSNNKLTLSATSAQPNVSFAWSGPNNFSSSLQNPVVSEYADSTYSGKYYVYLTDKNTNCKSAGKDSVTVVINSLSAGFTNNVTSGFTPVTIEFENTSINATNYFWNLGDNKTSIEKNPLVTYEKEGIYTAYLIAFNGPCTDTVYSAIIDVKNSSSVEIPNIFTPNDDGKNDFFNINSKGLKTLDAKIFNRWGELIYEWQTLNEGWSGKTMAGTDVLDGVYFYVINAIGNDAVPYKYQGAVNLIR